MIFFQKITKAERKAYAATAAFFGAGLFGWFFLVSDWRASLPLAVFYTVLLVNTFFSIRLFAGLSSAGGAAEWAIDGILVFLYFALALNLSSALRFEFIALFIFIFATAKYVFLLGVVPHPILLKRKIIVDLLGVLACALAAGTAVGEYATESAWAFAGVFTIANFLLFFVWPLYRADF